MATDTEQQDSIIHQLPPEISNKIAAGEVIQRPASVVKELLDNAIDAGADRIKILIQNAGRTLIQVIDNGCGMSLADLRLCFTRHATSKIYDVDDLFRVQTLGFRGEAMASIASVAQVETKSKRPEDDNGHLIEIWGGEERKVEPVATDDGTSIAIRNLFYNVPARRQFLKTDATENRHIFKAVQQAALANLSVGFELVADGDSIYNLPPQSLEDRIAGIFGKNYRASLIPFQEETSYLKVSGALADPKLSKKSRGEQFLFVNGRPFSHRYLTYLVLNLYDIWTGPKEYPFFAIFIDIDPARVDVNVHPAKSEVKFDDEQSVIRLVQSVVKRALNEHFTVPDMDQHSDVFDADTKSRFESGLQFNRPSHSGGSFSYQMPSRINRDPKSSGINFGEALYRQPEKSSQKQSQTVERPDNGSDKNFWQLHNKYIVSQTRSGLCFVDQHAAHRRVIYEKAQQALESALPSTQQLLFAQTLNLSATDFSLLKELHELLVKMGFNIQILSGNSAMISGVPADIDVGDEGRILQEILQNYRELGGRVKLQERDRLLVAFASKTAVPRGKKLGDKEMEALVDQLFSCEEPFKDPLGQPTVVYVPVDEIDMRFR